MATEYKDRKGVETIHLFNEVWRIGRLNTIKRTQKPHAVIYNPSDIEFHVYGKTAVNLYNDVNNRPIIEKVKIFILTNILDNPGNWEYDLDNNQPKMGQKVKIIYDNGTIKKDVEFIGIWEDVEIQRNYGIYKNLPNSAKKTIKPVCWRKLNV